MVEDGEVTRAQEYAVGAGIMIGSRLLTGAGYTLKVPAIDLAEVGAGGGSHVWIDAGGALQVGPESAGASPGPVCYDKGGKVPTVTDANVLLGYINPGHLVGGALKLNAEKARARVRGEDRHAARHDGRARGLRRASDRRLQHDPRHQGGVDRARPRSARVRAVRLRRQRPAVRRRHGRGARHRRASSCRRRPGCSRPSACSTPTSSITMRAPSAACCARPTSARSSAAWDALARAGARRSSPPKASPARAPGCKRSAALHYKGQSYELTVPVPDGPIDAAHGRASRGGLRRRSTSAPTAIAPAPTSRSSWSRSRSSARACARAAACRRA